MKALKTLLIINILILVSGYGLRVTGYGLSVTGYDYFENEVSVKSAGLGNCNIALIDNNDSAILNPAGLSQAKRSSLTTTYTTLQTDVNVYYLSYAQPLWNGAIGISWIQAGLDDILQTESATNESEEVNVIGTFGYASNVYSIAYGQKIVENIFAGFNIKYITTDMPGLTGEKGSGYGYSASVGLLYTPINDMSFGLKIDNIVNAQNWSTNTIEQEPIILRTGAAYRTSFFGQNILLLQDVSQVLLPDHQPEAAYGAELSVQNMAFRIGYDERLSAGFGIKCGDIDVNYAYANRNILSKENIHKVSLTYIW